MKKAALVAFSLLFASLSTAFAETAGVIPKFQVEVSVTDQAAEKLKTAGDRLEVDVYYLGDPVDGDKTEVNEDGQIELGDESKIIFGPGTVDLGGSEFDASLLDHIVDHEAQVLINVNSSKLDDNILDCGVFEDKISVAAKAPVKIICDLPSQ